MAAGSKSRGKCSMVTAEGGAGERVRRPRTGAAGGPRSVLQPVVDRFVELRDGAHEILVRLVPRVLHAPAAREVFEVGAPVPADAPRLVRDRVERLDVVARPLRLALAAG